MLSTGRLLTRDDARDFDHGRLRIVDRGQQLRQQRRAARNELWPRLDALEDVRHRLEYRRMVGILRAAQRLARCVIERVGDETAQGFVPMDGNRIAGRAGARQRAVRPGRGGDGIDARGFLPRHAQENDDTRDGDDGTADQDWQQGIHGARGYRVIGPARQMPVSESG
jgi:hypothetical protein